MFTWVGDAYSTGAAIPFTAADTPPSEYGLGLTIVVSVFSFARFLPKIESSMPGAPCAPLENVFPIDVIVMPETFGPSTNITGMTRVCGCAFGDWITIVARYAPGP